MSKRSADQDECQTMTRQTGLMLLLRRSQRRETSGVTRQVASSSRERRIMVRISGSSRHQCWSGWGQGACRVVVVGSVRDAERDCERGRVKVSVVKLVGSGSMLDELCVSLNDKSKRKKKGKKNNENDNANSTEENTFSFPLCDVQVKKRVCSCSFERLDHWTLIHGRGCASVQWMAFVTHMWKWVGRCTICI